LAAGLAHRTFAVPWLPQAPIGLSGLESLLAS
jgi:arsenite-transporting ATPase